MDGGFIELSAPSVAEAVGRMPVAAHPDVVAVPLVLTAAGHGKGDIPAALARERQHRPSLRWRYGRPLGPHPVLLDLLAEHIDAALAGRPRAGTQVVLAGRGSTDPDGNAEVAKVARLLWEGRGYAGGEFSSSSRPSPRYPPRWTRCAAGCRAARRGAVLPVPWGAPNRVGAQAGEFADRHPRMEVPVAEVIGECAELADLVLERYDEAVRGDIRMNCDTCAYRMALPGFADKVEQPANPAPSSGRRAGSWSGPRTSELTWHGR